MSQVEVRIRHEDESDAVHLCTWDLGRLDEVIPLIQRWGVAYNYSSDNLPMSGQFVVANGAAFFEVLIHADDQPEGGSL